MRVVPCNYEIGIGNGDPNTLDHASDTYVRIEGIKSVDGPGGESPEQDVSDNDTRGFRDYITGLADGGEIQITGTKKYPGPGRIALRDRQLVGTRHNLRMYEVDRSNGDAPLALFELVVLVKSYRESGEAPDGNREYSASLRVSGVPVFNDNPSSVQLPDGS